MQHNIKYLFISSDSDSIDLKNKLIESLSVPDSITSTFVIRDLGFTEKCSNMDSLICAKMVSDLIIENDHPESLGVLLSKHGTTSILTNKIDGIRSMLCVNEEMAKVAKETFDINVICIPTFNFEFENVRDIVRKFMETKFDSNDIENVKNVYITENLS